MSHHRHAARVAVARPNRHVLSRMSLGLCCTAALVAVAAAGDREAKLEYPRAKRGDLVEDLHGQKIPDPYRWLEEPRSKETRAWIEAENKVTTAYLEQIPQRENITRRLTELWNYERYGVPVQRGGKYFFARNDGLQNQSVLYVADSPTAEPSVLLDPNKLSEDGTVALNEYEPSDDGKLLAYALSTGGSDWREVKVRDVASGQDTEDHLQWVKFSGLSWLPDGSGFFYSRYDEPKSGEKLEGTNYFQKLYFHKLGDPQENDRLVYERPDHKDWGFGGSVSEDGAYLLIHVWQGTERKNAVFYQELTKPDSPVVELLSDFDAEYDFIGNEGPVFWFRTDRDAPRRRIVALDTREPAYENWKELVPEAAETMESAGIIGERIIALYLKDAQSAVRLFDLAGKHLSDLDLPGIGTAMSFTGRRKDTETFFSFMTFITPPSVFRYDLTSGKTEPFRELSVKFNADDFETKQVFYSSKDGTRVPMFLTYKKGLKLDGNNPTLLYGYGGFNIPMTPRFYVHNVVWLEQGGIYAVANLRGGGEYGREWHDGGRLKNKQNVFDDFYAAAEWLIDNNYTRRERLAIHGRSNGGLLVGAAITQRPDLFAAAVPGVGVMDMLRFHKFTIGWAWVSDYGSPDEPDAFETLKKYSPLHNIQPGEKYPATFITTADHDDRVVPAHSFKFAAALQAAQGGDKPILIRIETSAGHGAGIPVSKQIEEAADTLAFLMRELGMEWVTSP